MFVYTNICLLKTVQKNSNLMNLGDFFYIFFPISGLGCRVLVATVLFLQQVKAVGRIKSPRTNKLQHNPSSAGMNKI